MLGWVKRFWWILVLLGCVVFFWIRRQLREAERAAIIARQLDLERQVRERLHRLERVSRTERHQYEQIVEAGRVEVEQKKQELDQLVADDVNALSVAWTRAFGTRREPESPASSRSVRNAVDRDEKQGSSL